VDAGQVDSHAADDLSHQLDGLTHNLDHGEGHRKDSTDKITALRADLTQLLNDGKMTTAGYQSLSAGLDQLAASLPTADTGD
jgi:serine/threonine-protein kinase